MFLLFAERERLSTPTRTTFLPALLVLAAADLTAQAQTAAGSSSITAKFDPLAPPAKVDNPPPRVFRGQPVVGWEEYNRRKANLPQRVPSTSGPDLELVDTSGVRSPQKPLRSPLALTASLNFEGIQQTNLTPPDPDMAVGPEDIIQVVNASIARYSKTGEQTNLLTMQQWFASILSTVCPTGAANCTMFDPSIHYDQLHGRFLFSVASEDTVTGKDYFLLSVSNGATYAGGWKHFALNGSLNGTTPTNFTLDFPCLGYDNNFVYLTGNMFSLNTLQYAKIRILKKTDLYNPATNTLPYQDIWNLKNEDGTVASSLRPTILRGRPGVGASPALFVNASDNTTADYLSLWRVNNPGAASPTASVTTIRGLWTYAYPALFAQQGSTLRIDPGDSRVLKAVIRNNILFTARNAGYTIEPTTVTYDRIDLGTNKASLQARSINGSFFYPAFDITASLGPDNVLPNKLIAGSATASDGTVSYIGIPNVKAGESPYEGNSRWGDYFGGQVDPVQGGLWVYGEYAKNRATAAGRWGTWAAYFPWATTSQFADVPNTSPYFDYANVMRLWSITLGCTPTTYCPGDSVTRGQMAVFLIRALAGDTFDTATAPYFTDVPTTHPYFRYIQKMKELGITVGCSPTTYCPESPVTRSQMAAFLIRGKLANLFGDNFTFPSTPYFTDVPATDVRFSFIQKLRELGITSGCGPTTYCPDSPVTREQMAVFIVRSFLN